MGGGALNGTENPLDQVTCCEILLQPLTDNGGISLCREEHFFHTRLRGARERKHSGRARTHQKHFSRGEIYSVCVCVHVCVHVCSEAGLLSALGVFLWLFRQVSHHVSTHAHEFFIVRAPVAEGFLRRTHT